MTNVSMCTRSRGCFALGLVDSVKWPLVDLASAQMSQEILRFGGTAYPSTMAPRLRIESAFKHPSLACQVSAVRFT